MTYEFDGSKYEKASTVQRQWGTKLVTELALQGSECVLDLGCGDGTVTVLMADQVPQGQVVGIDASQGMLDAALPKARPNLEFLLMDINEIDFVDRFDVIMSNATLHWVKDHERLLRNVHRALCKGGRVRFNFAGQGNCAHFLKVVREAMRLEAFAQYFSEFEWPWTMPSVEAYRSLVESSDLRDVRAWGESGDQYYDDWGTVVQWIDQPCLVPFLAELPAADQAGFRQFVIDRMLEETRLEDGRFFETFRRINLSATR